VRLERTSGTTPDQITVSFQDTGLADGHHFATITLTSPATGEPLDVPVDVRIGVPSARVIATTAARFKIHEVIRGVNIGLGLLPPAAVWRRMEIATARSRSTK